MSYAYSRNTGASSLPSFTTDSKSSVPSRQPWNDLPNVAKQWMTEGVAAFQPTSQRDRHDIRSHVTSIFKRVFTITNAVVLFWAYTLWWGERTVFQQSIDACAWENWERWPQGATPHHITFIADPQLVDPHTYPGRPWPLSTLTVDYTDQYLRRAFSSIQDNLIPDSVLFLGDLFDGGREWATRTTTSPEERYQGYTDSFWKKEFGRFMKIFLDPWMSRNEAPVDGRGRRLIASLPGNHDLGFGHGVQEPVRDRFQAYFGNGNRVDVIGNHTIVSVDTVSLSAMDQVDPQTGSSSSSSNPLYPDPIWKESNDFLNTMAFHRATAENGELRMLSNSSKGPQFDYRIVDPLDSAIHDKGHGEPVNLPTILLTHVPLFRKPATPCGPLRERYPPSSTTEELEEDEPNSLKISGGYQYQNVLTPTISNELVSKAGPNVVQVYSGDDHDYCELIHREFNGSPREITVKSLSWAMGVRHPGFLMTSLWNPIDPATGKPTEDASSRTIQNHLCILPDQLGIFIYYGCLLGVSIVVLFISSAYQAFSAGPSSLLHDPILPLSERHNETSKHLYHTSGTSSSTLSAPGGLASRGGISVFPRFAAAKGALDAYRILDQDEEVTATSKAKNGHRPARAHGFREKSALVIYQFAHSVRVVALVVLPLYFILIWRW